MVLPFSVISYLMHHYTLLPSNHFKSHANKTNKQTNSKIMSCLHPTLYGSIHSEWNQSTGYAILCWCLWCYSIFLFLPLLMPTGLVPHILYHLTHRSFNLENFFPQNLLSDSLTSKLCVPSASSMRVTLFNSIICPLQVQFPYSEVYSPFFFHVQHTPQTFWNIPLFQLFNNFYYLFYIFHHWMSGPCRLRWLSTWCVIDIQIMNERW